MISAGAGFGIHFIFHEPTFNGGPVCPATGAHDPSRRSNYWAMCTARGPQRGPRANGYTASPSYPRHPIGTGFGSFYITYESSSILIGPGVLAFEYDHLGHHAPAALSFGLAPSQRSRANGYNFAPRYPSHINEHGFGIFDIFRGDSLGLTQFGAFAFEDELFSQLQFFRLGARPQAAGTSPILRRTAPVCIPQQQRSAAGAQQQRHGLSAWAVTHMGQSHVGHTAHTHTHTHTALLPAWYIYNTMYLPNYNRHPITYPRHVRLVRGGAVGDPI